MEVELSDDHPKYTVMDIIDIAQGCMSPRDFAALLTKIKSRSIQTDSKFKEALFDLYHPGIPIYVLYYQEAEMKEERPEAYIHRKKMLFEAMQDQKGQILNFDNPEFLRQLVKGFMKGIKVYLGTG